MSEQSTVRMTRAQDKDVAEANVSEEDVGAWEKRGWVVEAKPRKATSKAPSSS